MSILEELNSRLTQKGFPVETGIFSEEAPDTYIVITPLSDTFDHTRITHPALTYRKRGFPCLQKAAIRR